MHPYTQVHQLHVVLVKKRDPMSQVTFLESTAGVGIAWTLTPLILILTNPLPHMQHTCTRTHIHPSITHSLTKSDAHQLLTHFWETITEDLAVEFAAAAKG